MGGVIRRLPAWLRPDPLQTLGLVMIGAAIARTYRLRTPNLPVIFDENFYVNAARIILGIKVPVGLPYSGARPGVDPNPEHPVLGKLLIAGSMKLFGDDPFGWRLPSLLAGLVCIALVYAIVRAVSPDAWLAVLAATIFAFDNLVLVQSRIATLDIPFLAFLLLGVWLWLKQRPLLAGVACAVAVMIKETAVLGLAALVLLGLGAVAARAVRQRQLDRAALRATGLLLLSFVVVWLAGSWIFDSAFTTFDTPWAHLRAMLDYGFYLKSVGVRPAIESRPWHWWVNDGKMTYDQVASNVIVNGKLVKSTTVIDFRGAMNPVMIGAAPLAVSYVAWRAWRVRDTLSVWVVAWIATTYLVYFPLVFLSNRITYFFYILQTVPALAIAIAMLLRQARLPPPAVVGYLAALFAGFILYFPFRTI
jgi:predicted membrane-bound dolichyl-phosphate-mannose-protein mannosyltransferase